MDAPDNNPENERTGDTDSAGSDERLDQLIAEVQLMRESMSRMEQKIQSLPFVARSSMLWWSGIHAFAVLYGTIQRPSSNFFYAVYFAGLISILAAAGITAASRRDWLLAISIYGGFFIAMQPEIIVENYTWMSLVALCFCGGTLFYLSRLLYRKSGSFLAPKPGFSSMVNQAKAPVVPRISDGMVVTLLLAVSFAMIGKTFRSDLPEQLIGLTILGIGIGITYLGYASWLLPGSNPKRRRVWIAVVLSAPVCATFLAEMAIRYIALEEMFGICLGTHASCFLSIYFQRSAGYHWVATANQTDQSTLATAPVTDDC